jgi:hypothetical protein
MVKWLNWPKIQDVAKGTTLYADILNHCKNYKNYVTEDSKATSAHECTHGCNSDVRNAHSNAYERLVITHNLPRKVVTAGRFTIHTILGRVNGFYVGNDHAIVLQEPNIRKHDIVPFIPSTFHGSRYSLYITGQQDWDDTPLYVYDEGVAYINGAWAQYELIKANEVDHKDRIVDGHIEFIPYMTAVMMAADKVNSLQNELTEFSKWLFRRCFNVYFLGKDMFPAFPTQDKIYDELRSGSSADAIRSFLKTKLDYSIPTGFEEEVVAPLTPDDFHLF